MNKIPKQQQIMQKTGIESIDKFFKYGQNNTKYNKLDFQPLINDVLDMFKSEYTQNLYDRKASKIIKYCQERKNGFFYQEIQGLTILFQYIQQDLQKNIKQMIPALQAILNVDSLNIQSMFNKNMSSDQLRYGHLIPAYLNSLQPFLKLNQQLQIKSDLQSLRLSIIDYLRRFAQRHIPQILQQEESFENQKNQIMQQSPVQILMEEGTRCLRALAQSNISESLMQLLFDYENQAKIIYTLLELFSYMMMYNKLAYDLCQKGIVRYVLQIMLLCNDFRNKLVRMGFEILWSAVEGVGVETLTVISVQKYIYSLQDLFISVIKNGYKLDDKYLRNEILILINYLLSLPQTMQYFLKKRKNKQNKKQQQYCFLEILFKYSTSDESKNNNNNKNGKKQNQFQFGINAQDLELKKLFWNGLLTAIESNNSQVINIAYQYNFIKYLLMYIDTTKHNHAITKWSQPQLKQLQQNALMVLSNVILHMKDDFEQKKGIFCLTKFLSNINDYERRQKCLKAFSNASLFEQSYKIKITQQGIMDYLIQFLQGDQNPIQIKQLCLIIIANLCQNCKRNKKLFREKQGIDIIITYLKDSTITTSNRYLLLGIALLNCLWNAILGSRRSQQRFLNSQGVFDLLQFIEICDKSHKKLSLSCLSYLTENNKSIQQFLDWNSEKTMINATQLMIKLYVEQDDRYGVKYNQGVIMNRQKPLIPNGKPIIHETYLKDLTQTGAQTYLTNRINQQIQQYDIRMVIFSILYRVGFNKNDLNAQQQQKIQVIQMYPHFKMGEIWGEIKQQFQKNNFNAIEQDKHWMQTNIQQFQQQIQNCIHTQSLIMKQFHKNEQLELNRFYQVIKYNKHLK